MFGRDGIRLRPGFDRLTLDFGQLELGQRNRRPFATGHGDIEYGRSWRWSSGLIGRRSRRRGVVPASVKVPAGATSATFEVSTNTPTAVTIYGNYGVTKSESLSVVPRMSIDQMVDRVIERERAVVDADAASAPDC